VNRTAAALETARGAAEGNGLELLQRGRIMPPEEFEARLAQVTPARVRRVALDMLREGHYALSGFGPKPKMPSPDEIAARMRAEAKDISVPAGGTIIPPAQRAFSAVKHPRRESTALQMTELPNGLRIMTVERSGPLAIRAAVGSGKGSEAPAQNGMAHLTEHMNFLRTALYGPGDLDRVVERALGGDSNAATGNDMTIYELDGLSPSGLKTGATVAGELVFHAALAPRDFGGERRVVVEEVRMAADDMDWQAGELMRAAAYPGQSHGRPVLGTQKTLRAMTAEGLAAWRNQHYVTGNVIIAAAGPVRHEDFVAAVVENLGGLPKCAAPPAPEAVYRGGTAHRESALAGLCTIIVGTPAASAGHPDSYAYDALSIIMGAGSSSRLHARVVGKLGLTPQIFGAYENLRSGALLTVIADVGRRNVKPLLREIFNVQRGLPRTITQAEVDKAKTIMETDLEASCGTNGSLLDTLIPAALAANRLVTREEMLSDIRRLTLADVRRVAAATAAAEPAVGMMVPKGIDKRHIPDHKAVLALKR
jgi:predicted Zn-dependent peptidase